jgi:hypothetical protein
MGTLVQLRFSTDTNRGTETLKGVAICSAGFVSLGFF